MLAKTRGIVLHTIPYNDRYTIIYMYTERFGRASYLTARTRGRKSNISKALFMPLSVLELDVEHKPKRELHRIKDSRSCFPLSDLQINPIKNIIGLFIAEVLFRIQKETEPDERFFQYLLEMIHFLETTDQSVANFHLVFLLHLTHFLGIQPNFDSYQSDFYFDMLNGEFINHIPNHRHYLNREESLAFSRLFKMTFENSMLFGFSRQERIKIIEYIITYYRLHLPEFSEIKSLSVLQSIFNE